LEREITDHADFTGRVAAVESVDVRARVSGYLKEVAFQAGQEVKEGQLLFLIEPVVYEAALQKAEAEVSQYTAQLRLAESEAQRSQQLLGSKAVAQEDVEKIMAQRLQATANLEAAKAMVRTAKENLGWTRVLAPVAGKTGVNLLTKGNLVVADQTLLTTLVSQDPMYIYFNVDERTMLRAQELIRQGKATSYQQAAYPVLAGLANEEGFPHKGVVDFVSNQVQTGTGTLNVRGKFPNQDRKLTPGVFARVRIPIGQQHKALLVTDRALGSDQGRPFLLVVGTDNQVARRDVEVGTLHEGGLREIKAGLGSGEWVVVEGLLRVRPGLIAAPQRQPMPIVPTGGGNGGQGNGSGAQNK